MKYARKMVLIPEEEYMELKGNPPSSKTSQLKRKVREVLRGTRDHSAATQMSQLVGSYLRHKQSEQSKPVSAPKKPSINFQQFFEPIYEKKVTSLLSQLKENRIGWTQNKELQLPTGQIIPHSNIVDLIKEALVGTRKKTRTHIPTGWREFIQAIAHSNIPKSFFTKRTTQQDLEEIIEHQQYPRQYEPEPEPEPEQRLEHRLEPEQPLEQRPVEEQQTGHGWIMY